MSLQCGEWEGRESYGVCLANVSPNSCTPCTPLLPLSKLFSQSELFPFTKKAQHSFAFHNVSQWERLQRMTKTGKETCWVDGFSTEYCVLKGQAESYRALIAGFLQDPFIRTMTVPWPTPKLV